MVQTMFAPDGQIDSQEALVSAPLPSPSPSHTVSIRLNQYVIRGGGTSRSLREAALNTQPSKRLLRHLDLPWCV